MPEMTIRNEKTIWSHFCLPVIAVGGKRGQKRSIGEGAVDEGTERLMQNLDMIPDKLCYFPQL